MYRVCQTFRNRFRGKGCGNSKRWIAFSFSGLFPAWLRRRDFDDPIDPVELADKYGAREELTWRERLDLMWRIDEFGNFSPELDEIRVAAAIGFSTCFCYGGIKASGKARLDFIAANKHTMFSHPREAQRAIHNVVLLHFLRSGIKLGLKAVVFVGSYFLIANTATVVFNRVNPLDHMFAGFVTAACWRTMGGPRAMLASGVLGSFSGLTIGALSWIGTQIRGEPVGRRWLDELRRRQEENDQKVEAMREKRKSSSSPLYRRADRGIPQEDVEAARQSPPVRRNTYEQDLYGDGPDAPLSRRLVTRLRWLFDLQSPADNPDIIPATQPIGTSVDSFTVDTWMDKTKTDEEVRRDKELRAVRSRS